MTKTRTVETIAPPAASAPTPAVETAAIVTAAIAEAVEVPTVGEDEVADAGAGGSGRAAGAVETVDEMLPSGRESDGSGATRIPMR